MKDLLGPASLLYPDFAVRLTRAIRHFEEHQDFRVCITMGVRSFKKQASLYAQGRTAPGKIVTDAKPGFSVHHYGGAADIATTATADPYLEKNPNGEKLWERWGECVEAEGLTWGGRWKLEDKPHAQMTYGMKVEDMLNLYRDGGIPAVWRAFDRRRGVNDEIVWAPLIRELRTAGFEVYTTSTL